MITSTCKSNSKRIVTIAIAAAIATSFAVPSWAASKVRHGATYGAAAYGAVSDPARYPTYRSEGGCIEDQGFGRLTPCTSN
jgi:hypothetical protein